MSNFSITYNQIKRRIHALQVKNTKLFQTNNFDLFILIGLSVFKQMKNLSAFNTRTSTPLI